MVVVLMMTMAAMITMPLLQKQVAIREIEFLARRFIAHAQFARQQALHLGEPVRLEPLLNGKWEGGWMITSVCMSKAGKPSCVDKVWLTQGSIEPIFFQGGGKSFTDPHTGKVGILFNAAGAAKSAQGGFVANRLILRHSRDSSLERQLILGSGGRWRICDPSKDAKRCH